MGWGLDREPNVELVEQEFHHKYLPWRGDDVRMKLAKTKQLQLQAWLCSMLSLLRELCLQPVQLSK